MRGRYLLALSVALAVLLAPSLAFADDGFLGGLQDLVGAREVEQQAASPEQQYLEEYEPEYVPLRADGETEMVEGDEIQYVVSAFNKNPLTTPGAFGGTLLGGVRQFFGRGLINSLYLVPAVGLVFMWWGVRKSLRILMNAWRKGHASV